MKNSVHKSWKLFECNANFYVLAFLWPSVQMCTSLRINIAAELGTRQKKMAELGAQSVPNQGSDLAATTFVTRNHLNRLFEPLPSVFWQNNRIPCNWVFFLRATVSWYESVDWTGREWLLVKGVGCRLSAHCPASSCLSRSPSLEKELCSTGGHNWNQVQCDWQTQRFILFWLFAAQLLI